MKAISSRSTFVAISIAALLCVGVPSFASAGESQVVRNDQPEIGRELNIPIYHWQDKSKPTQAFVVALHGATLHGGAFDTLARELAGKGYEVLAPDFRGFGRWYLGEGKTLPNGEIAYYRSREDVVGILLKLRSQHPNLPIVCMGESLGANMAFWLASVHPDLIDGIIASSPCSDRQSTMCKTFMADFAKFWVNPKRNIPLEKYARRYLSEDDEIIAAYLKDAGNRKTMTFWETMQSFHANKSSLLFVDKIPASMPILVLVGEQDRMYRADAIKKVMERIHSNFEEVITFKDRGHIHLETPHLKPDILTSISTWIDTVSNTRTARNSDNTQAQATVSGTKL